VLATEILAGTGTTVTITLVTDGDVAFGSATTLITSTAIANANTAAGKVLLEVVIPPMVERYLRIIYTTDNTFETTGRIAAWIDLNIEKTIDKLQ
jgi:AAA+ ATPase superfamily predicted ATPase